MEFEFERIRNLKIISERFLKWQFLIFFLAVILGGVNTGFYAKAAVSQCELVYKLSGEYKPVSVLGNSSSVKIERNREFYLKYETELETIAGSSVMIYVKNETGDPVMIAKVICASLNEDYYYDSEENCAYIPISLKQEQGSIKVYFSITLANGVVKEKYEPDSEKAFCLDLLGEYSISYNANGGTNAPDPQTKYAESPLELTREEPVREGYIFKGWAESSTATEADYHPGDMYTESRGRTLFAVWKLDLRPEVSGPADQSVKVGESAVFSVIAEGDHPDSYSYQWYIASSKVGAGTMLMGETNSNLVIAKDKVTQQLDGFYYYCIVYDGYSDEYVESSRGRLTVYSEPTVTAPAEQGVKEGEAASFHVTASGGNPSNYTYQWFYALSKSDPGTKIDGAVSSAYTIPGSQVTVSLNGRYYYCMVSNGIYHVTSSRAKLTVQANGVSDGNGGGSNGGASDGNGDGNNGGAPDGNGSGNNGGDNAGNGGGNDSGSGNSKKSRKTQKIKASSYVKEYGSKAFYLKAKTSGDGKLTYSSSNRKVASVTSKGKVSVKKYGMAVITIRASKTAKYNAASKKVEIEVVPKRMKKVKIKSPARGEIEITWKEDKTVTGYKLELSLTSNFKLPFKANSYKRPKKRVVVEGLSSGKTYYFRIRSYVKVGKSNYKSPWSKVKKVKVK